MDQKGFEIVDTKMLMHRDFKPENVLITKDGIFKITNFGFSQIMGRYTGLARLWKDKHMKTQTCTMQYRFSELYFNSQKYYLALDFGKQKPLFLDDSEMKILSNMINIFGNPNEYNCPSYLPQIVQFEKRQPKNLSKEILKINGDEIDSLQKMLQYDPNTKISVKDALKHRYITSIKKRNLSKKVMQIIQNKFK